MAGATTSSLALTNVQLGQAGAYSVTVTNSAGFVTSEAATLTVLSDASRIVRIIDTNTSAGSSVTVPVRISSQGNENAIGFSVTFDPSLLQFVNAAIGTGASGAPRPAIAALLDRLLDLEVPVVAIDGPTGVDLLTGNVHGAARADLTITFGGLRRGHLLARDEVGALVVVDIGHPPADPEWPTLVTDLQAADWLLQKGHGVDQDTPEVERPKVDGAIPY